MQTASGDDFPGQMGPLREFPPPRDIRGRRDLANYEPRPPPTDFEPWKQAEAAIADGTRVESIVRREFTRDFGPHALQCVLPCGHVLDLAARPHAGACACSASMHVCVLLHEHESRCGVLRACR